MRLFLGTKVGLACDGDIRTAFMIVVNGTKGPLPAVALRFALLMARKRRRLTLSLRLLL
jgi:hypothetical protein